MKILKLIKTLFKQFILIMFSVIALFSFFKMNNHLKSKKDWQKAVNQMLTAQSQTTPALEVAPTLSDETMSQIIKISLASLENRFYAEVPRNYQNFQKQNQVLVQKQTQALLMEISSFFDKYKNLQVEQVKFYQNCSSNLQLVQFARSSCLKFLNQMSSGSLTANNLERN